MSNAVFGWQNYALTGSLITSSATPGLDGAQLQNDQGSPSTAWQSAQTPAGGAILITMPSAVPWRAFGLFRTNLTPNAVVSWYLTGYAASSSPVAVGYGQAVLVAPNDIISASMQVNISDPTNPDGFINIPLIFAGPAWQPQTNIDYSTTFGRDDQVDETVARGGQEFPAMQFVRRRWDVSLQGIRTSEVWPQAMALDRSARAGGNVLFVPDPNSATLNNEAVFGRLKSLADLSYPYGGADRRAWKARITERL